MITGILAKTGFKISIDDLGSGFTSITSIYKLPLYQIKLDKELVNQSLESDACRDFIQYIAESTHKQGISLVAEGVENKSMMKSLYFMNISCFQGYYIQRPENISKWLQHKNLSYEFIVPDSVEISH